MQQTFEAKNNDPKEEGVKTYTIATVQDIADCVTIENLEGFLTDFEILLRGYVLLKRSLKEAEENGDVVLEGNLHMPQFEWTDDWKH